MPSTTDYRRLCALFYIINNMDRIPLLTESNFQLDKLRVLLPASKWAKFTESSNFTLQILQFVQSYWATVEDLAEKGRARMLDRVQFIYKELIKLAYRIPAWSTYFFAVTNYDPPSLPGGDADLLLGVSNRGVVLMRKGSAIPLLEIPILKLDYKITLFSIFIETN